MVILKCKMCGGDLDIEAGVVVADCEYCGTKQTIPNVDNEKKMNLFNRANRLRFNNDFDKAMGVYESIVAEFPEEAESYWGLCLCKYGIEYVDDPATARKIPTCHRTSYDSIFDDQNFEMALEYADAVASKIYREEAREIERLQKAILDVVKKEEPFDIFICYKETDENGDRTMDSVLAQDVYDALTQKGYKVFFSRITLEDKLGQEYEPYIFAALTSAKVMLAFGTCYEYYNAVWVKNEWSRFLDMMKNDKEKYLIPCYKNIDAYDMPREFGKFQAQDLGKVGAVQDLVRGIEKLIGVKKSSENVQPPQVVVQQTGPDCENLLRRAFMFLEDGNWSAADEYCEKVLDIDSGNAQAYLGKLLAELKVKNKENLKKQKDLFDNSDNYKKAIRFGDEQLRTYLSDCLEFIKQENENEKNQKLNRILDMEVEKQKQEIQNQIKTAEKTIEKYRKAMENWSEKEALTCAEIESKQKEIENMESSFAKDRMLVEEKYAKEIEKQRSIVQSAKDKIKEAETQVNALESELGATSVFKISLKKELKEKISNLQHQISVMHMDLDKEEKKIPVLEKEKMQAIQKLQDAITEKKNEQFRCKRQAEDILASKESLENKIKNEEEMLQNLTNILENIEEVVRKQIEKQYQEEMRMKQQNAVNYKLQRDLLVALKEYGEPVTIPDFHDKSPSAVATLSVSKLTSLALALVETGYAERTEVKKRPYYKAIKDMLDL